MVKKILIGGGVTLVVLIAAFFIWLNSLTKMEQVMAYEFNESARGARVLIATQGSEYKDGLTASILEEFKNSDTYFKVIDVTGLDAVDRSNWDAIIFMQAWEIGEPHQSVADFVGDSFDSKTMFMVTTADDGESHTEGIDGVTGESMVDRIDQDAQRINTWLEGALARVGR